MSEQLDAVARFDPPGRSRLAEPEEYRDQADSWRRLASSIASVLQDHTGQSQRLVRDWHGVRSESFAAHARSCQDALGQASDICRRVAQRLEELADTIDVPTLEPRFTTYQDDFDASPSLTAVADVEDPFGARRSPEEEFLPEREQAAADLRGLIAAFAEVTDTWSKVGMHGDPGWEVPEGGLVGVRRTRYGHTTVITTGDADDSISVHVDPDSGATTVTVVSADGTRSTERVAAGQQVVLNTGEGSDSVRLSGATADHVRVVGAQVSASDSDDGDPSSRRDVPPGEERTMPVDPPTDDGVSLVGARPPGEEHTMPVDPPTDGADSIVGTAPGEEHTMPVDPPTDGADSLVGTAPGEERTTPVFSGSPADPGPQPGGPITQ